jgi:NADP-dependent 3-hydroxy acid dehydrogenase YdfG
LAQDVAFHSPILTKTVYGQENVEAIHQLVDGIQGVRTYIARFTSTKRLVEYWNCAIDGHLQQGIDVFELDDDGTVTEQTVWLRPWPVVTLLRDRAMAGKLSFLTADYWVLPAPANPSVVAEDTEGRSGSAAHPLPNPGAGTVRRTRPHDAQAPESDDALPVKPALDGTVALVTGASSGIGAATAAALAAQGAAVALAARRRDRLDALAAGIREHGGTALALECDITDRQQATEAVERTVAELGRLDTLVNNAGVMLLGPAVGAPLEEWQQMVELNLLGLLYCARAALPHLLRAAGLGPRRVADMVNISSAAGRVARSGSGVYNLTKFGIGAFSESLRQELIDRHVRISLVEPGAVDTELASHNRPEIREQISRRFGGIERLQSEDTAAAITFIVTRPRHVAVNEILIRPTEER